MKKLLLFLPIVLIFSCSVQKRKYQSGYYVDWHSKKTKKEKPIGTDSKTQLAHKKTVQPEVTITQPEQNKEVYASADTKLTSLELKKPFKLSQPPEDTCDVLVFKDGSEIKGKVLEVGVNEVKYKRCDTPEGPTYISRKSELFMIKYAKGTREVIKSEEAPRQPQLQTPSRTNNTQGYKQQRYNRQNHPLAISSLVFGVASLVIAYIALEALAIGLITSGFIFLLPFIAALIAVVTGKTALNRIREQPDLYKGKGMAIPGFIMGLSVLGIYALVLFFVVLLVGI